MGPVSPERFDSSQAQETWVQKARNEETIITQRNSIALHMSKPNFPSTTIRLLGSFRRFARLPSACFHFFSSLSSPNLPHEVLHGVDRSETETERRKRSLDAPLQAVTGFASALVVSSWITWSPLWFVFLSVIAHSETCYMPYDLFALP